MRGVRLFGPWAIGSICALILVSGADPLPPSLSWTDDAVAGACDCPCHANPVCDEVLNIADVIRVTNAAFGGEPWTFDPPCTFAREDVDCDGSVGSFDVVAMVAVVFRGEDPASRFCDPNPSPCSEILDPGLCNPAVPTPNNSVVVESKTVSAGATGIQVGVYVENSLDLRAIVLPLEIRTVTGGAYMAGTYDLAAQGRVVASGLMDSPSTIYYETPETGNPCSGPVSQSYTAGTTTGTASAPSDAVAWYGFNIQNPCLAAGSDGMPGAGIPSFLFTFDIGPAVGTFEIDTCCVMPSNHMLFGECGVDNCLLPSFTKGVITVEAACLCPCHGDPLCDGLGTIIDLVRVEDGAFGGAPGIFDPGCPFAREDVDCNGTINVFDVVKMADVVVRGADPAVVFCDPNPSPCSEVLDPEFCELEVPTPGNAIVVESRQVTAGATGVEVGIYVANAIDIDMLILPLEIREVSGGAYMANSYDMHTQGRIGPGGFFTAGVYDTPAGNSCSGPVSQSYSGASSLPGVPSAPSDAIMLSLTNTLFDPCLSSGTDGSPGSGTPSLVLTFDVSLLEGTFEIDTCCVAPGNHLVFAECGTNNCILPSFVKGVITVVCDCDCAHEPVCDGVPDVLDIVSAVNVGIRNLPDIPDPNPFCPWNTTDVNCDGLTDIFDVVHLVSRIIRNESPEVHFCDPCP